MPLERIREAVVFLIALVLSIAVHEFGHAIAADKLGDRTPRAMGRVTLNPIAHADFFGTLLFPLISILSQSGIMFGWGKPVLVNPLSFNRKFRRKTAHLLVAAAGPAMNVILAIIVTFIYGFGIKFGAIEPVGPLAQGIFQVILLNWVLFFFNLIPCPPLDGGTVLAGVLPDRYEPVMDFLRQYGFLILLGLMLTRVVSIFVRPAIYFASWSIHLVHTLIG